MKSRIIRGILAVVLTAALGRIQFDGHTEVYYNLPMRNVVERAQNVGIPCEYWIRESDGVKMFGPWVIVAAHPSKTRYSRISTSLGEGIILDNHEVSDPNLYDIAVTW